ncbi:MAG: RNA 2',3'-cyclic phosphodiesterase [Archaeoglobaceae archaeon]|nr:RNA 2',3'-cyclic phosphodiesterase [Archaeoglobaceae archaeon]MCX8152338.1 RNA 2',3'-cyclic phosphodiesterase [Archaeoglobaceae archaeon]MDW8013634.1 RNA 2',3'-cyclic phosphodiesterase [Archaeoglobaceae archaeon]
MRLFIAVDMSEQIKDRLSTILSEMSKIGGVKVVEKENLHVTLLFLGEVPEFKVEQIKKELSQIDFKSFEMKIKGLGAFPSKNNPRVVWAGIVGDEIRSLAEEVYAKMKKIGFKRDKDFEAHVTVARMKRRNDEVKKLIEKYEMEDFGSMKVENFKLKQSILKREGPIYIDLALFSLR